MVIRVVRGKNNNEGKMKKTFIILSVIAGTEVSETRKIFGIAFLQVLCPGGVFQGSCL